MRSDIDRFIEMMTACPDNSDAIISLTDASGIGDVVLRPVVLVVDDEPLLRMMAVDFVEDAGFEAVEAVNADDAIALLERRPDVRIVFTDVNMPGTMDGIMLAAYVRRRWPLVELIVTSGLHRLAESDLPPRGVFFPKPYQREHLLVALAGFKD